MFRQRVHRLAVYTLFEDTSVIAASAYHHIPDNRKHLFLSTTYDHLSPEGLCVIYEKFVAPFRTNAEAARSGTTFYAERIFQMLETGQVSETQIFALYNEMYLTSVRRDEYKVSYDVFAADVDSAGFTINRCQKMWPEDKRLGDDVGDFVVSVEKIR